MGGSGISIELRLEKDLVLRTCRCLAGQLRMCTVQCLVGEKGEVCEPLAKTSFRESIRLIPHAFEPSALGLLQRLVGVCSSVNTFGSLSQELASVRQR